MTKTNKMGTNNKFVEKLISTIQSNSDEQDGQYIISITQLHTIGNEMYKWVTTGGDKSLIKIGDRVKIIDDSHFYYGKYFYLIDKGDKDLWKLGNKQHSSIHFSVAYTHQLKICNKKTK